jgi:septal ring factor EnvC (AmiA/AmiB activator)
VHKAEGRRFELHPRRVVTALRRGLIVALCLAVTLLCRPASAQEDHPDDKLKVVEKALEESRKNQARYSKEAGILAADLARLRDASVAAAQTVQLHEAAIADIEEQLGQLAIDEGAKLEALQSRARQYDEFLMALQRLARNPPEALALAPGEPVDAVRSALLLSAAIPQIEVKARELQAELDALAALRRQTARKRQLLLAETTGLTKQQQSLKALIARKAALQDSAARRVESTAQRLQQLSAEAGDLHQLIESLEAERRRRDFGPWRGRASRCAPRRAHRRARQ